MVTKRKGPGIYLETDTGPKITLILTEDTGEERRFPPVTPAEDLLAIMDVDYTEYRKEIEKLRDEHPLFEERIDIPVADYEDLIAEACMLPSALKDVDPVSFFILGARLDAAFRIPDDGSASFLLWHGMQVLKILEEPILTQIRLRNIFEVAFEDMERANQRERFERLLSVYPDTVNRHFLMRRMETQEGTVPLGGRLEYTLGSLYELRLLELALYFQQEKQRIARCAYCWNYFVPRTKAETCYCDRKFDGQTCKRRGANLKRNVAPEQDEALKIYNTLRHRMAARLERYEDAAEWDRDQLIQMTATEYYDWITMAQHTRTEYLHGQITAEEFLRAIDVNHELSSYETTVTQPTDPQATKWRRQVERSINFDPVKRYQDMMHLDLGKGSDAQWEIISAEDQIKADHEGHESLRDKYRKE